MFYRFIINRHSRASGNLSVQKIQNPLIIGANIFGDYENNDKGDFLRYSIGGELRDKHFALAANFYLPIADERKVNSTVIAFSRRGYDAKLRAAIPHLDIAKIAVDYYRFRGRGDTKADKGFRYGAELHPLAGLRIGVLYDDNAKKIGGDIAYSHSIGKVQTQQNNNADNFTPDLFAPVSREYSQRIALVTTRASMPEFNILSRFAQVDNTVAIAALNIPNGYFDGAAQILISSSLPQADISVSDTLPLITIYYTPSAASVEGIITIIAQGTIGLSLTATSFIASISSFAGFAAAFDNPPMQSFVTNAMAATVGTVSGMGGIAPYQYRGIGVMANITSGLILFDRSAGRTITAMVVVSDNSAQTPDRTINIILTAEAVLPPIVGTFPDYHSSVFVSDAPNGIVGTIMASGGDDNLSYSSSESAFMVGNDGEVRIRVASAGRITTTITIDDSNSSTPPVMLTLSVSVFAGPCAFYAGCAHFGHNLRAIPSVPVARMMARAGVDINGEFSTFNNPRVNARDAVIVLMVRNRFLLGAGSNQLFEDVVSVLIEEGADINYQSMDSENTSSYPNGRTALDECNTQSNPAQGQCRAAIASHNPRCNHRCEIGDTNVQGQICTSRTSEFGQSCT